jgi:hypothetical protein
MPHVSSPRALQPVRVPGLGLSVSRASGLHGLQNQLQLHSEVGGDRCSTGR